MPADALTRLANVLRVPSSELSALVDRDEAELDALTEAVMAAMRADTAGMEQSIEHAIRAVPRPFRRRARRLLTGGGRG